MKRILVVLLALAMLASACCFAESELSLEEQAQFIVFVADSYFTDREILNSEQMFSGFQVVVENEFYGFGNSENSLTALVACDPETNSISSFSFICDVEEGIWPAFMYCSVMPFAQMYNDANDENIEDVFVNMQKMSAFLDANYEAAVAAFDAGESFFESFSDSDYGSVEWSVTPLEGGARMMLTYYFHPFALE